MSSFNAFADLDTLRLFIQERIREWDPSLDTSSGSEIDSTVIQPLIERLAPDPYNVPIRDFIVGRLTAEFPDLIVQDGEPIDDYAVKVMQILLEPFRRQIQQISNNQSFAQSQTLSDTEADNLGANFFQTRKVGGYAVGPARLYFTAPQYFIASPNNLISTGGGLQFVPVESQAITLDDMLFNTEDNLYYFDIIVRAEKQGTEYNIGENALTSISGAPAVVKVTNKVAFEEGKTRESTEEFIARVEQSLTEKSLVTKRGILARLPEVFDTIRLIGVIGFGDAEMMRDIVEGASSPEPYAFASGTTVNLGNPPGNPEMTISGLRLLSGSNTVKTLAEAGVTAGDTIWRLNFSSGFNDVHTITRLVDADTVEATPNFRSGLTNEPILIAKPDAGITISDIPGGITGGAPFEIQSGQVHIGGALDVFVRAATPQVRETILEGIRDGQPLHFGVDLESFGAESERLTHLVDPLGTYAFVPQYNRYGQDLSPTYDQIMVRSYVASTGVVPWRASTEDVTRYIQLLGPDFGTFEILEILDSEIYVGAAPTSTKYRAVRLKIDLTDQESGLPASLTPGTTWNTDCRLVEKITRKSLVRDRDGSRIVVAGSPPTIPDILAGVDFAALGVDIGDSVVVETGDDAGIYSVRRILSWVDTNDSLVLDRDLTTTVTPSGLGDGSGLRYRVADELNVDLVSPKVTKIPLGSIFAGDDLDTVAGSAAVSVGGSTNFLLAGVETGDSLEVLTGDNAGVYGINAVTGTTATLDAPMATFASNLSFAVYRAFTGIDRPMVRVKQIELLDSNSQPTGQFIPYGDAIDGRILGILGNRAEGKEVESFTGVTGDDGSGNIVRLSDANRDFVAEGITAGHRLNILNTLNAGEYTIQSVAAGYVDCVLAGAGGVEFRTEEGGIHYTIGRSSGGYMRLYFLEPTSVEIDTGITGGRVQTGDDNPRVFRFSEVEGYNILPAGGSEATVRRDLRVVLSQAAGPDFNTLVELTDTSEPSVLESELQPGDILSVNEEIKFRNLKPLQESYDWQTPGGGQQVVNVSNPWEVYVGYYIRKTTAGGGDNVFYRVIARGVSSVTVDLAGGTGVATGIGASEVSATMEELGVMGQPAGLRTVAGSNRVTVPAGSLINFLAMDALTELVGQALYINSGPDTGSYVIEEVVDAKTLRLDKVMTASTGSLISEGTIVPANRPLRNAYLAPNLTATATLLTDPDNNPGTIPERFVTLYETTRGSIDGTYEITDIPAPFTVEIDASPTDIPNPKDLRTMRAMTGGQDNGSTSGGVFTDNDGDNLVNAGVRLGDVFTITGGAVGGRYRASSEPTGSTINLVDALGVAIANDAGPLSYEVEAAGDIDPYEVGRVGWVLTANDILVEQPFRIYNNAPTEAEILEVAPVGAEKAGISRGQVLVGLTVLEDTTGPNFVSLGVVKGDLVEVVSGANSGVYPIESVTATQLTIYGGVAPYQFFIAATDVPYRVWSGIHGDRYMMKVGPYQSFSGKLEPGYRVPYVVRRPGVMRLSSTVMADNLEGSLYYADVQIESQGSGDELNLPEGTRMVVTSGMRVDGYTYTVANNTLTFSPYEQVSLNFDRRFLPVGNSDSPANLLEVSGRNIKIIYESSTVTRLVNDLLRSDFDRPINASPLGRHFLPSYVFLELVYRGGAEASEVGEEIAEHINGLGALTALEVSDIEAMLTRRGANYVRHPMILATVTHDLDRVLVVDRSYDSVGGTNAVPYNGSGRTSAFFAILGEGLIVTRE